MRDFFFESGVWGIESSSQTLYSRTIDQYRTCPPITIFIVMYEKIEKLVTSVTNNRNHQGSRSSRINIGKVITIPDAIPCKTWAPIHRPVIVHG